MLKLRNIVLDIPPPTNLQRLFGQRPWLIFLIGGIVLPAVGTAVFLIIRAIRKNRK